VTFKAYFEEKFSFDFKPLPKGSQWRKVGDKSWALSFAYDKVNKTVGPVKSSEFDTYTIFIDKIYNPHEELSSLSDFTKKYPNVVKQEPYIWIVFDSSEHGSDIASKEESPRAAKLILDTIVSALMLKITEKENIAFDAKVSEPSRVKLYRRLAYAFAQLTQKNVTEKTYLNKTVYFLIH
jgi:hypothetical protein